MHISCTCRSCVHADHVFLVLLSYIFTFYILSAAYAKFVSIILIAEAQENAELGDSEEHVEQEQEEDTNVEGDGNGGASGKL